MRRGPDWPWCCSTRSDSGARSPRSSAAATRGYGAIASVSVLVVLGILVAVNYVSAKQNKRWDLTCNRQYTLSEQTIKLLQGAEDAGQVHRLREGRQRIDRIQVAAERVRLPVGTGERRVHRSRQEAGARQGYKIQSYGTVVVEHMGRRERGVVTDRRLRAGSHQRARQGAEPDERSVYFLAGHGEKDPTNTERGGYSSIIDSLRQDNFSGKS